MTDLSEEFWVSLGARSSKRGLFSSKRIGSTAGAFAAIDDAGGRHLLIGLKEDDEDLADRKSRGLSAETKSLQIENLPQRRFIDVACGESSANDAFSLVCNGILRALRGGLSAPRATSLTLARWRRFWGSPPIAGLSPAAVRGLFGELWFLRRWLLPRSSRFVLSWTGPAGAAQDFVAEAAAVEVKATISPRGHIHVINGLRQLDVAPGTRLFVFSLRLRESETGAQSLTEAVEAAYEALRGDAALTDAFELRLASSGYTPTQAEIYAAQRFDILDERLYSVSENFPRLTHESIRGGVPAGIERVEYVVDLDGFGDLVVADNPDAMPPLVVAQ